MGVKGVAGATSSSILAALGNPSVINNTPTWRGLGQRMYLQVQGFGGGTNWSQTRRTRHYSNYAFRYFRIVIPTFYPTGTPIADVNLPNNMTWQIGFEYPYTLAGSGIAARIPVTFSAANTASYSTSSPPATGYILSDVIDAGQTIPAGAFFGLWKTDETSSGAGSNTLPYTDAMTNFVNRYEGYTATASSRISAGTALSATSIAQAGTNQSGYSQGSTPAMMLIQIPANQKVVLGAGDSILNGTGEGTTGSTNSITGTSISFGDSLGSPISNSGYPARMAMERFGYNFINFGHGSDQLQYITSTNWKYRLQLMTLANPTHIFSQNVINDTSSGSSAYTIQNALINTVIPLFQAAVPGVPIIQTTASPSTSASSDSYESAGNQTAQFGAGTYSSVRGQINTIIQGFGRGNVSTYGTALQGVSFFDINPYLENGYLQGQPFTQTSLWNFYTAQAYGYTSDGIHPNSYGARLAAMNVQSDPFY